MKPVGTYAVAFLYEQEWGGPTLASYSMMELGLDHTPGYNITEVFDQKHLGCYKPKDVFTCLVNPMGVYLIKAVPL